jgi:YggT family protein
MIICKIIHVLFFTYSLMVLARCVASWVPGVQRYKVMHFLMFYTDPYLNFFRKFIPPIGGTLDLSPLVAFFVLRFAESLLIRFLC